MTSGWRRLFLFLELVLIFMILNNISTVFGPLKNLYYLLLMINIILFIVLVRTKTWVFKDYLLLANFIIVSYYAFYGLYFGNNLKLAKYAIIFISLAFIMSLFKTYRKRKTIKRTAEEAERKPIDVKVEKKEEKNEVKVTTKKEKKSDSDNGYFIGNSKSKIFHKESCRYVEPIPVEKRVVFNKKSLAKRKKYKACKFCKP